MKIEIKCRFSGNVLFEQEGNTLKTTVEAAIKANANLANANLAGANLAGANLAGANLAGVNLAGANLAGANLVGANLAGVNLAGVNLAGVNLKNANLTYVNFTNAKIGEKTLLKGERPIFQIGPIGSRCAYFVAYITENGILVSTGCFKQKTIAEFREELAKTHGKNKYAEEYEAALALIEKHAEIWG